MPNGDWRKMFTAAQLKRFDSPENRALTAKLNAHLQKYQSTHDAMQALMDTHPDIGGKGIKRLSGNKKSVSEALGSR